MSGVFCYRWAFNSKIHPENKFVKDFRFSLSEMTYTPTRSQQASNTVKKRQGEKESICKFVLRGSPGLTWALSYQLDTVIISRSTTNQFWLHAEVGAKAWSISNPMTSSQFPSNSWIRLRIWWQWEWQRHGHHYGCLQCTAKSLTLKKVRIWSKNLCHFYRERYKPLMLGQVWWF